MRNRRDNTDGSKRQTPSAGARGCVIVSLAVSVLVCGLCMTGAAAEGDRVVVATSGGLSPQWDSRTYKPDDLWPFQPVERSPVPADVTAPASDPNAIDAFI